MSSTHVLNRASLHAPIAGPHVERPPRDQFLDVVRVLAIVTIVGLHWLMPVLSYDARVLTTGNALAANPSWAITWIGQVMPLIFFVGGAASAISLDGRRRRHGYTMATTSGWLADRLRRLAVPVLPLAVAWTLLPHLMRAAGVPEQPVHIASELVGRLLWFLAAYLGLIVLTPLLLRLHDRCHGAEIAGLATAAVVVDVVRFGGMNGMAWPGYANVVLVWGTIFQVGVHYGRSKPVTRRASLTVAALGLAITAVAVAVGPYALSMIGMPGEPLSNINPPTAVLLGIAAIQLGLLLAMRSFLVRWAERPPVTAMLGWVSHRMMTIYLWHTPALVLTAGIAVLGFGYATAEPFSAEWRNTVPGWVAALTAVLAVLVHIVGRFEHPVTAARGQPRTIRLLAAFPLVAAGLLALTVSGFSPAAGAWPVVATVTLMAGVGLASGRIHLPAGWGQDVQKARLEA